MQEKNIIERIKQSNYFKEKYLREKGIIILNDHRNGYISKLKKGV
tara:strand:- start:811 stop:945 length:135 start_codon:yes stop_codon:yes gene_type:complete